MQTPSIASIVDATAALVLTEVFAVYSGALGCACGCKGSHTSSPAQIKRTTRKMINLMRDEQVIGVDVNPGVYVSVTTETRMHIAYTSASYSQKAS